MAKKLHADKLRERVVKGILPPAPASWRKIMAYNVCGDIGVIYDQSKNALIGLVDPCDVFDVNRFCISYLRKEVHDGIRLSADAGGGFPTPLAHIVLALHKIKINTNFQEAHHVANVCDNRLSELQVVKKGKKHPAKTHGTKNYIRDVLAELGYDSDAVLCAVGEMVKKPFADALSLDFRVNVR